MPSPAALARWFTRAELCGTLPESPRPALSSVCIIRGSPLSMDVEGPSCSILRLLGPFLKAFRLCYPEHPSYGSCWCKVSVRRPHSAPGRRRCSVWPSVWPKPVTGGPVLPQGAP